MQKLLVENEWYEALPPAALDDLEYEALLNERAEQLFPEFHLVQLRCRISNDYGHAFPQLALINRKYTGWWVVLLESGGAPSTQYINQKAQVVREGRYGPDIVRLLQERNSAIDPAALSRLLKEVPRLFVVVGHPPVSQGDDWDVRVGVAEVFKSQNAEHILRINGEQPDPGDQGAVERESIIGQCTRNILLTPTLLRLTLADSTYQLASSISVEVEGVVSEWIVDLHDEKILLCVSAPLPAGQENFTLTMVKGGRFRLIVGVPNESKQ